MSDIHDTLERESVRYAIRDGAFDRLSRRRDRKQRNQRIAALVVGLAIAIGIVVIGTAVLRPAREPQPADRTQQPILHVGEVLDVVDDGSHSANTLVATDIATRDQRTLAGCTECAGIRQFAASAAGRWIAYDAIVCLATCEGVYPEAGIWVVGAAGPPIHVTTELFPGKWAWSPTAEQLAFAVGGGKGSELFVFDPATGERTSIVTTEGAIPALAWSPDGSTIAYAAGKPSEPSGNFVVRPGANPERIGGPYIMPPCCVALTGGIENLVWSPDGMRLAVSTQRDGVTVVRIGGSGERTVLDRQPDAIAWSPDGRQIAFADGHEVGIVAADGGTPLQLGRASARPGRLVWSPDGRLVAFTDKLHRHGYAVPADGSGTFEQIDRLEVEGWMQG